MKTLKLQFPYGAVYFRKSNPPREDWEQDYRTADEDGMNIFRHWCLWGAVETAPGVFDWDDYDRHLDLAEKHGMRVVLAEMITSAPEWVFAQKQHLLYERADGKKIESHMGGSCATGGFSEGSAGVVCLDHGEAEVLAGGFLRAMAERYRSHPALLGYDLWNECNYPLGICYCGATRKNFAAWLEKKYGSLKALNQAWHRYSYADWSQVAAPRTLGPYPDSLDWLDFKKDNFYAQLRWRAETIRTADPDCMIIAHGVAGSITSMATMGADDWAAAAEVDLYGFTWVQSRKGSEPWKQWHAVDLVRAASRGKTFWHAETQGGPLWLQPQVVGRSREDGRVTKGEDIRIWNLISMAGGTRGLLNPRWRPLLDGPLFGAFGAYGMDGSRTARSKMASEVALWANRPELAPLWEARPVQGEIGILVVPESQTMSYLLAQAGDYDFYARCLWGAYRGFFDNHIQADWVHIDHIQDYKALYLPYPIMLSAAHAAKLIEWISAGGRLVCEACPAYFGDGGSVGTKQPNLGLAEAFGAVEETVEFMPDISQKIDFDLWGARFHGALFRQSYAPTMGAAVGTFAEGEDGRVAAVDHAFGAGKTLLIGCFPSAFHHTDGRGSNLPFFRRTLDWMGIRPRLSVDKPQVQARLQEGAEASYLWVLNPTKEKVDVVITLDGDWKKKKLGPILRGQRPTEAGLSDGGAFSIAVEGKDAFIAELR